MFKLHMQILYQTSDTKSNHTSTIKPEHKKKKKKKITSICIDDEHSSMHDEWLLEK